MSHRTNQKGNMTDVGEGYQKLEAGGLVYRRKVDRDEGYVHCDCGWAGETHETIDYNRCPKCYEPLHEGIGPVKELFRSPKDRPQSQEDFW